MLNRAIRPALLVLLVLATTGEASAGDISAGSSSCEAEIQSYGQVLSARPPKARPPSSVIIAASEPGCAELVDPKSGMLGPISLEINAHSEGRAGENAKQALPER